MPEELCEIVNGDFENEEVNDENQDDIGPNVEEVGKAWLWGR